MKISFTIIIVISLIGIFACNISKSNNSDSNETKKERIPITTVDEAISYIESNFKNPEETLWIDDSLNDNVGMNMAIIGDKLIKTGYMPNGFEQKNGYRIYKYKKL